jgi:DNA repair ATPase RecN
MIKHQQRNSIPFVAAIDDSGGLEALVDWSGNLISGDQPITVLSMVFIRADRLEELNQKWNELRKSIQNELECNYLPAIHMRLMWGKNLKKAHRRRENAYAQASFKQISSWIYRALEIAYEFNREKAFSFLTSHIDRRTRSQVLQRYLRNPKFRAEMLFIRENSYGKHKTMYRKYHNIITSPLLPAMGSLLQHLNETQ